MACLEVLDIPSAASTDDLGLLVAQFAPVQRVLLLSHGPGTPGSALVWVAGGDAAAVADALDSHPLAGGLISVRLCGDPMRWVVSSVGTDQVGHIAPEATLADLTRVFSKFGPIYAPELRRAPESGKKDQWGFVNYSRVEDAEAAYAALRFRVVPELSGEYKLKLQYRPLS
ncbi:hypothetical protein ABPG75_010512 [Micractinium tetrahymenae]